MKSETIHKRQIIDFLSEWAENKGEWASLLLDMVISKEDDITDDDRNKIYSYLEKSLGLNNNLPKLETKKYNFNANEINSVTIKSLSNVKGVNKLSPDQTINFSDKLTVVYGQNGTGKSGYSRIFKSLGYCYDKSKDLKIYPNIFSNDNPQLHATINCTINGEEKSFEWIGNTIEDLNSISIYDSKSVGISTSTKREIMITPAGFHLFSILSSELGKIEKLIDNKIISLSTKPEISDSLHSGTKQHEYYFTYPHNLTIDILNELSNFDEEADSQKLKSLIQQKGGLNLSALNERLRNLRIGQSEIEKLISNKQAIKDFVTIGNIEKFDELNDKLLSLKKDSESSISTIAEEKGVELYNSKEFLSFIESAEKYIKQFDKNDLYPRDKDEELCIFCRQPLRDSSARKLIQDYRKVLNSTRNKEISTIQGKILEIKRNFSQLSCDFSFKYPIFEEKEMAENKGDNIVPFELTELINFSKNIKSVVIDNKEIQIQKFDFSNIDKLLEEKKENLSEQINALNDLSKNISTKVASIEKEINELEDKLVYKKNKNVLTNFINNLRYVASLRKAKTALSTKSLSTKLNEANSELVIKKFESKLMEELKFLRKDSIPITINFSATKGTTKVEQTLEKSYPISDILSEGETKAISLAEFLAEVELNATNAPVIFDDPVNSLDHRIIELVADRLIKLSYERQVILFTHNILLFNCIYTKSKESSFIETQNNSMYSGVIKENSNLKNNVKRRVSEINSKLNVSTSIITVEYLRYLYSCLRSTIELLVEQKIFQDVVKRYQSNVSMTNFQKVKGHLIDKRKDELNQIFERCCRFTEAHSSPEMVDTDPDINDFKSDFTMFKTIYDEFNESI